MRSLWMTSVADWARSERDCSVLESAVCNRRGSDVRYLAETLRRHKTRDAGWDLGTHGRVVMSVQDRENSVRYLAETRYETRYRNTLLSYVVD